MNEDKSERQTGGSAVPGREGSTVPVVPVTASKLR